MYMMFYGLFTLLRIISGARYSGVPHSVHVLPLTLLAKPKSVTWTVDNQRLQIQQALLNMTQTTLFIGSKATILQIMEACNNPEDKIFLLVLQ